MFMTLAFVNAWVAFCAAVGFIGFYETLCNCDHPIWKFDWNCDYTFWKLDLDLFVKFFLYMFLALCCAGCVSRVLIMFLALC